MVHTIQNKTAKKKSLKKVSTSHEADTQKHSLPSACLHSYHKSHATTMQETQRTKRPFAPSTKNEEGKQDAQCLSHFSCLFHTSIFLFVTFWGSWSTHKRNVILCTQTFLRATFWLYCWHSGSCWRFLSLSRRYFLASLLDSDSFGKRKAARCELPLSACDAANAAFMRNDVDHHPERIPKPRYIPAQLIFSCIPASAGRNWAECKPISWPAAAHERATKKHGEPSRPSMLIHSIMVFK